MQESEIWSAGRPTQPIAEAASLMERVLFEVKRVVVGQDVFLERMLIAIKVTF
jgi:MoxR-like ATPase